MALVIVVFRAVQSSKVEPFVGLRMFFLVPSINGTRYDSYEYVQPSHASHSRDVCLHSHIGEIMLGIFGVKIPCEFNIIHTNP